MSGTPPSNANQGCVGPSSEMAGKAASCAGCPNQRACASSKGAPKDPAPAQVKQHLASVKHTILVLSGKGGVGKSTFASQLAWALADRKREVGLLDIDICGPSAPRMLGVEDEEVHKSGSGWSPVMAEDNLAVMSVGFMLQNKDDAIIWRGPRKTGLIKQFLTDVDWGELDYLIVDSPPGTSDEHISIAKLLRQVDIDGAVIVTTPQEVSLLDVRKEINFCKKTGIPILGVVENMGSFVCPACATPTDVFPALTGGAVAMAKSLGLNFLGSLPMDPSLLRACENGVSFLATNPTAPAAPAFRAIIDKIEGTGASTGAADRKDSSSKTGSAMDIDTSNSALPIATRLEAAARAVEASLAALGAAKAPLTGADASALRALLAVCGKVEKYAT